MHVLVKALLISLSSFFTIVGLLMFVAPTKYPSLYAGFSSERVIQRETTEQGKRLAMRMQGLVALVCGVFFALFIWAVL